MRGKREEKGKREILSAGDSPEACHNLDLRALKLGLQSSRQTSHVDGRQ